MAGEQAAQAAAEAARQKDARDYAAAQSARQAQSNRDDVHGGRR